MKKTLMIIFVVCFLMTSAFAAEVYIKQNIHTDAFSMMGRNQPAKDQVNHIWLGDNRMAMHGEEQSIIIDLDKKVMDMIQHQNKTYVEMTLPLDIDKYWPAQMSQMFQNMTVSVSPTGETQKVGQWNCKGYDVTMNMMMMEMKLKVWASTDVPFDWKSYNEKMMPQMTQAMMRLGEDAVKEFSKIEGYQIKTEMSMNIGGAAMKTTSEVVEITKKSAPAGTYSAPAGYEKKEMFSMQDMQR